MARLSEFLRSGADGALLYFCPGCQMAHQIFVGEGAGPRWSWNEDVDKPTFEPSVRVSGIKVLTDQQMAEYDSTGVLPPPEPSVCHVFVRDGMIQFLDDCTHEMAGMTVPIPPFNKDDD